MRSSHVEIVLPATGDAPSGVHRATAKLRQGLETRGWTVGMIDGGPFAGPPQAAAIERQRIAAALEPVVARWRRQPPDVVHLELVGNLGRAAGAAAAGLGIPVTSWFHNLHLYAPAAARDRALELLLQVHRLTVRTFVADAPIAAMLRARGIPGVTYIPRGVDAERFHPRHRDAALRHTWGAGDDDPVLLWVGRVVPAKDPRLFAAVAEAARAAVPGVRAVVVGGGPELSALRAALPWAVYAGVREGTELAACFASADIFVFTSATDSVGNVNLEAMASGLPVVSYAYAAPGAHVRSGTDGLLVPLGDPTGLVAAAAALARDLPAARRMGMSARAVAEGLGWDAACDRYAAELAAVARRA